MTDHLTIRGVVGTEPRTGNGSSGTTIAKFRLVTNERRQDPESGQWVDVHSNWYTVSCFRAMASNMLASLHMGDHVVVYGKVQLREFDRADGTRGFSADIEAISLGHDLRFGVSTFDRVRRQDHDETHPVFPRGKSRGAGEEPETGFPVTGWPESTDEAGADAAVDPEADAA